MLAGGDYMHLSLYRKHRPRVFAEVAAQEAAVDLLRREIGKGRNSHAYLFSGPRGCGKTTLARIVAKALNCSARGEDGEPCAECSSCLSIASGNNLDVVEIDGASNRGIDEIRELKEHISLSPFSGKFKVYIIDEVHMLTDPAFNALLKTLEEPPQAVVFILATTEPHKVPATIRSRCQHIPFHRIPVGSIVECLESVSAIEGATLDKEALWEIARESDGSLRDALSLLEQALSTGLSSISLEDIRGILGGGCRSDLEKLLVPLREGNPETLVMLETMLERGLNAERLMEGMFIIFRDLLVAARWGDEGIRALPLSEAERIFVREEAGKWKESELWRVLEFCTRTLPRARFGLKSEVIFGMFLGLFSPVRADGSSALSYQRTVVAREPEREPATGQTRHPEPEPQVLKVLSVPQDECKDVWEDCVKTMSVDNLPLYCACIPARVVNDGNTISIVFPVNFRFGFEIAVSPRGIARLDAIRRQRFPGMEMRVVCGERIVDVTAVQDFARKSVEISTAGCEEAVVSASSVISPKRQKKDTGKSPAEKETVQEQNGSFAEVQRCFNADLLMFKEDNADGTDMPEGAPVE